MRSYHHPFCWLLLLLCTTSARAQHPSAHVIDSLFTELEQAVHDTSRAEILCGITEHYFENNEYGKALGTAAKAGHFRLVVGYAVASWLTMAIITAILGFMMTPGTWLASDFPAKPDYIASLFNPSWMPSLGFRTFFAIVWAAAGAMTCIAFLFHDWFFILESSPWLEPAI